MNFAHRFINILQYCMFYEKGENITKEQEELLSLVTLTFLCKIICLNS